MSELEPQTQENVVNLAKFKLRRKGFFDLGPKEAVTSHGTALVIEAATRFKKDDDPAKAAEAAGMITRSTIDLQE